MNEQAQWPKCQVIEKSCSSYSNENKPSFFLMAFIHSCQVTGVTGRILCDAASNVKVIARARLEVERPKSISDKKRNSTSAVSRG